MAEVLSPDVLDWARDLAFIKRLLSTPLTPPAAARSLAFERRGELFALPAQVDSAA